MKNVSTEALLKPKARAAEVFSEVRSLNCGCIRKKRYNQSFPAKRIYLLKLWLILLSSAY